MRDKGKKKRENISIFRTKLVSYPCSHLNWEWKTWTTENSCQTLVWTQEPLAAFILRFCFQAKISVKREANNWDTGTAAELLKPESLSGSSPEVLLVFLCLVDLSPNTEGRQHIWVVVALTMKLPAGAMGAWGKTPLDPVWSSGLWMEIFDNNTSVSGSAWGQDFFLTTLPFCATSVSHSVSFRRFLEF